MSTRGEARSLLRELRQAGHRVEVRRSGHVMVLHRNGESLVTIPGTPSDHRAAANVRATLRRNGFIA